MKKIIIENNTNFEINESYEGETIETKVERVVTQNEPIEDGAPLIYTERSEGIPPSFDIRTDRFDSALDAMDVVNKAKTAQRDKKYKEKEIVETKLNEPIQATEL